jgi:hypothetical protein
MRDKKSMCRSAEKSLSRRCSGKDFPPAGNGAADHEIPLTPPSRPAASMSGFDAAQDHSGLPRGVTPPYG